MENQPLCGPLGAPDDENALPSRGLLLKEEAKKRKCSPREEKGGGAQRSFTEKLALSQSYNVLSGQ